MTDEVQNHEPVPLPNPVINPLLLEALKGPGMAKFISEPEGTGIDVQSFSITEQREPVPFVTPSPMGDPPKLDKPLLEPERFTRLARQIAVDNYNANRYAGRSPVVTMDQVYIVWFTKVLGNWKAIVASSTARGLMWEITFNGHRKEAYVEVYKKLNSVKVPLGED
jgi:hypothetical protein